MPDARRTDAASRYALGRWPEWAIVGTIGRLNNGGMSVHHSTFNALGLRAVAAAALLCALAPAHACERGCTEVAAGVETEVVAPAALAVEARVTSGGVPLVRGTISVVPDLHTPFAATQATPRAGRASQSIVEAIGTPDGGARARSLATRVSAQHSAAPVPLPAAAWLFGSAILGFVFMSNRRRL